MIFETHAHYDDEAYDTDREKLFGELLKNGICRIVNAGARMSSSREGVKYSRKYPFVFAAVGVHPDDCKNMTQEDIKELRELAEYEKTVAIGEIGLDYHGFGTFPEKPDKETQHKWFEEMLKIASDTEKAVIIHSRNACEDTLEVMKKAHNEMGIKKAVIHCFSYSQETAREYIDMGYYIGIGGVATYEGQRKLNKVISNMPIENMVLETDCPYLAPVPHKGERNSSLYLTYVRDKIAELKGMSPEDVERITWENANRLFGLQP